MFKYRLLFSNGAPNGPPFTRVDHVQQLLPFYIRDAVALGEPEAKQTLLPYALCFNAYQNQMKLAEQPALRNKLNIPVNRRVILSVGAVNCYHKRMDYVVSEFSKLNSSEYFLVILGQMDKESHLIVNAAERLLSPGSYMIKQVPQQDVNDYFFAADYFLLASFNEGLPRVLIEALSAGLIPIVHDYTVTRETLGNEGVFLDLSNSGVLKSALCQIEGLNRDRKEIITNCWERYSWDRLTSQYTALITKTG